jgi:hypothetical protein
LLAGFQWQIAEKTAERAKEKVKAKAIPLLLEADFTILFYLSAFTFSLPPQ